MTTSMAPAAAGRLARTKKHAPLLLTLARSPKRVLRFFFSRRAPWLPRLVALATLAYVVVPIDLVPDVAPVIGWLDDAGLAALAFGYVTKKISEFEPPGSARGREAEAPSPDDAA